MQKLIENLQSLIKFRFHSPGYFDFSDENDEISFDLMFKFPSKK